MSADNFKLPLGELLQQAGLISAEQIRLAALDRAQYNTMRFGEILAIRGWVKPQTTDFFAQKWYKIIQQGKDQPIGYYFQEAGLLDENQIKAILWEQKRQVVSPRFGEIAQEKGWLKSNTIDFFLENLLPPTEASFFSRKNIYEIIKQYMRGETDFPRVDLSNTSLQNVTLKKVNFRSSNFQESDLRHVNLSGSILIAANLAQANLERAVLNSVDLSNSCLQQANLTCASLEAADLRGADLKAANLTQAYLVKANLIGADLRTVKLQNTFFNGALYNHSTKFSHHINPAQLGMKFVSLSMQNFTETPELIVTKKQLFNSSLISLINFSKLFS